MDLTSGQKKFLRAKGQRFEPLSSVGKAGLTEQIIQNIQALLAQRELIKVRLAESFGSARADDARQLAEATGSAVVAVVGRNVMLYRPNDQLEPRRRIHLPQ
jgi:RNA-binding protein